jgi:DNA-binding NarL/FixJ family response regulator
MTQRGEDAPKSPPLRVVLADDSGIFGQGLHLLLEAAGAVVEGVVGDGVALVAAVVAAEPDVAVVDVRMPPTHTDEGIRAALEVKRIRPETGVLVLSTYVQPLWVTTLLDAIPGGVGYLLKDRVDDVSGLLEAMRRVAAGGIALDPEVVSAMVAARRHARPMERLTDREREVLSLLAQGRSNAGIARSLQLSVKTVEGHVASVFRALDLHDGGSDNRRVKAALTFLGSG